MAWREPRFRVDKVTLEVESEGPDYFRHGEYRVVDTGTGDVVAARSWSLDETFMVPAIYTGPKDVRISDDGAEAIVTWADRPDERIALPPARGPVAAPSGD